MQEGQRVRQVAHESGVDLTGREAGKLRKDQREPIDRTEDGEVGDGTRVHDVGRQTGQVAILRAERLLVVADQIGRGGGRRELEATEVLARIADPRPLPVDERKLSATVHKNVRRLEVTV